MSTFARVPAIGTTRCISTLKPGVLGSKAISVIMHVMPYRRNVPILLTSVTCVSVSTELNDPTDVAQ